MGRSRRHAKIDLRSLSTCDRGGRIGDERLVAIREIGAVEARRNDDLDSPTSAREDFEPFEPGCECSFTDAATDLFEDPGAQFRFEGRKSQGASAV